MADRKQHLSCIRFIYGAWCVVEMVLFSGVQFGWNSFEYVLKRDGLFSELCDDTYGSTVANGSESNMRSAVKDMKGACVSVNARNISEVRFTARNADNVDVFPRVSNFTKFLKNNNVNEKLNLDVFENSRASNISSNGEDNEDPRKREHSSDSWKSCPELDARFGLVNTLILMSQGFTSALAGYVIFRFGAKIARIGSGTIFILGAISIAIASKSRPWFLIPGFILVSYSGMTIMMTDLQAANIFPTFRGIFIGLISGCFDASTGIGLLAKIAYENNISWRTTFFIYGGMHLLSLASTFLFLPESMIPKLIEEVEVSPTSIEACSLLEGTSLNSENGNGLPEYRSTHSAELGNNGNGLHEYGSRNADGVGEKESGSTSSRLKTNLQNTSHPGPKESEVCRCQNHSSDDMVIENTPLSLKKCLLGVRFLLHIYWTTSIQLVLYVFVGMAESVIEQRVKSDRDISMYTNITMSLWFVAIPLGPLCGIFVDYNIRIFANGRTPVSRLLMPFVIPMVVSSTLSLLLAAIFFFVEAPDALYASFGLVVVLRALFYTVGNGYVRITYPDDYFSFLYGVDMLISQGLGLCEFPIIKWRQLSGFLPPGLFLVALSITSYPHAILQFIESRRSKEAFSSA